MNFFGAAVCIVDHSFVLFLDFFCQQAYKDLVMELDVLTLVGQHQNLVVFYGACVQDPSNPVILEELVEGPNLEKYLEVFCFFLRKHIPCSFHKSFAYSSDRKGRAEESYMKLRCSPAVENLLLA